MKYDGSKQFLHRRLYISTPNNTAILLLLVTSLWIRSIQAICPVAKPTQYIILGIPILHLSLALSSRSRLYVNFSSNRGVLLEYVHNTKERWGSEICHQLETPKEICKIRVFQDGETTHSEISPKEMTKVDLKNAFFMVPMAPQSTIKANCNHCSFTRKWSSCPPPPPKYWKIFRNSTSTLGMEVA